MSGLPTAILCDINVYSSLAFMCEGYIEPLCDVNVYSSRVHAFMCVGYLELLCDVKVYA